MWNCESGDLPAVVREIHIPDHEVWLYRKIDFDKPTAHACWFLSFSHPFYLAASVSLQNISLRERKNMKKKVVAVLCAAAMTATLVAGCGSKTTTEAPAETYRRDH